MDKKSPSYPNCSSKNTCPIFWSYPGDMREISRLIDEEKISLGGCVISDDDPVWHYNDCLNRWGKRSEKNV